MDLIDRYLAAIASQLPRDKANDIIAELRDLLLTMREDREAELGRPLTPPEWEAMIKDFGHPIRVAARYRPARYLIGPELFPYWWASIKTIMLIVSAVLVTLMIVSIVFEPGPAGPILGKVIGALWSTLFGVAGTMTILFAVMERYAPHVKPLEDWRPSQLRAPVEKPQSRWNRISELTVQGVFLLWWTGVIRIAYPWVDPHGASVILQPGPWWSAIYWPLIAITLVRMTANLAALVGPNRTVAPLVLAMIGNVGMAGLAAYVWRMRPWVSVAVHGLPAQSAAGIQLGLNIAIPIVLAIIALTAAGELVRDGWRLWRRLDPNAPRGLVMGQMCR